MARKRSMDQADLPEDDGVEPVDDQRQFTEAVDDSRTDSLWLGERSDGERIGGERIAAERSIEGEELWDDVPDEVGGDMLSDESGAGVTVISLEALEEEAAQERAADEAGDLRATHYTDGSTNNPHLAWDQGLVYDPPHGSACRARRQLARHRDGCGLRLQHGGDAERRGGLARRRRRGRPERRGERLRSAAL